MRDHNGTTPGAHLATYAAAGNRMIEPNRRLPANPNRFRAGKRHVRQGAGLRPICPSKTTPRPHRQGVSDLVLDQNVRVGVQRERLPRVSELRRHLRHRDAAADLHGRVAVTEIMRVAVGDPSRHAGAGHDVLRHVGGEPDAKLELAERARENDRSLSAETRRALRAYLERRLAADRTTRVSFPVAYAVMTTSYTPVVTD